MISCKSFKFAPSGSRKSSAAALAMFKPLPKAVTAQTVGKETLRLGADLLVLP